MRQLLFTALTIAILTVDPGSAVNADTSDNGFAAYLQRDYQKALPLLRSQAAQGNATALYYLSVMARDGKGVPKDFEESRRLLALAATMGNVEAAFYLGVYDYPVTSARTYLESREPPQRAEISYALQYLNGWGVSRDYVRAYEWIALADTTDAGFTPLASPAVIQPLIAARLTARQRSAAQALAAECKQSGFQRCD